MTDTLGPGGATTTVAPDLLAGFPFPFPEDRYRYSTNVEPARTPVTTAAGEWGTSVVDIDSEYRTEIDQRAVILAADPTRHAVLPHMVPAAWDAMLTVMGELAATCPEFRLASTGPCLTTRWSNCAPS